MANGAIVAGVEVVKLLLMLAIQQAQIQGLSTEQVLQLYLAEKAKFDARDPNTIPIPK